VFLKEPSIPGLAKQKDTARREDFVTGITTLESESNAAGGGASLFHSVNRAKHVGSPDSNHTGVRALYVGPEAINGLIATPVFRSPQ